MWEQTRHPPCFLCVPPKSGVKDQRADHMPACLSVLEGAPGPAGRLSLWLQGRTCYDLVSSLPLLVLIKTIGFLPIRGGKTTLTEREGRLRV